MARAKRVRELEDEVEYGELDAAVAAIRAAYGEDSIVTPGQCPSSSVDRFKTGIPPLDDVLGGGIAKGTIIELFGREGAGKTTICLQLMAQAQKQGMQVYFVDMENALDGAYAAELGVDIDSMYMSQPSVLEEALTEAEEMIKSGKCGMVVIDSIAALVPQDVLDKGIDKETMGIQPRKLSTWLKKVVPVINKTQTIVIFTNQIRAKIGGYGGITTPGGYAIKHAAAYRIEVIITGKKKASSKEDAEVIGNELKIHVAKNKKARPFRNCEMTLLFGEGLDTFGAAIAIAIERGIIIKRGPSWYYINRNVICKEIDEEIKFQGEPKLRQFFKDNPSRYEELQQALLTEE